MTVTFQQIMTNIENGSVTSTSNTQVYITRQSYLSLVVNSNGNISYINLPLIAVSIINFSVTYFNFNPSFPFVVTDFITATDWVTYTLPN